MRDITMSSSSRFGHKRRTGSRPLLNLWVAASVLVLASLSVSSPALPRSNFNGDWSVIVQSRGRACAPTVRYPVAITNGVVTNGGETPATVQGRVAPNGTVRVTVQSGGSWASGSCRLTTNGGSGGWRGAGAPRICGGRWQTAGPSDG